MQKAFARNMVAVEKVQSRPPIMIPFTGYAHPLLTCAQAKGRYESVRPFFVTNMTQAAMGTRCMTPTWQIMTMGKTASQAARTAGSLVSPRRTLDLVSCVKMERPPLTHAPA